MTDVIVMTVFALAHEGEQDCRLVGKVAGLVALCILVLIVYESLRTYHMVQTL